MKTKPNEEDLTGMWNVLKYLIGIIVAASLLVILMQP